MSIEENFKDVIPLFTNKRKTYLRLTKLYHGDLKVKITIHYQKANKRTRKTIF